MDQDEKIRLIMGALQESIKELSTISKTSPDTLMGDVKVRGWLLASSIHLEHLEMLLKNIQPTLIP